MCQNRNRSAPVCELLSNNSLFVGQLYEDKSLTLRACDLSFFKTDLQTVNYYTTIHARADLFFNQLLFDGQFGYQIFLLQWIHHCMPDQVNQLE